MRNLLKRNPRRCFSRCGAILCNSCQLPILPPSNEGGRRTSHVLSSSTTQSRSRRRLRGSVRTRNSDPKITQPTSSAIFVSSPCRYPKYEMCMNNTSCKAARRLLKQQQEGKEEEQLQRVRFYEWRGTAAFKIVLLNESCRKHTGYRGQWTSRRRRGSHDWDIIGKKGWSGLVTFFEQ